MPEVAREVRVNRVDRIFDRIGRTGLAARWTMPLPLRFASADRSASSSPTVHRGVAMFQHARVDLHVDESDDPGFYDGSP